MKPKSATFKYALTGTNCSGKTTMALDLTARLKMAGVLAEVVSSQDRKITWKDDHFPVDFRAHYGMLTNLIHAEVQAELKGDAEVVLTDRSVLDLYAIATYDHPEDSRIREMENMVLAWCSSYTKIFYLEPLQYQADNKRPSDDFRMATHGQLLKLFDKYNLPNVVQIPRTEIFKHIKSSLGVNAENSVFAETEKWQTIANILGKKLMVKKPTSDVSSDYDVWILHDPYHFTDDAARIREMFGQYWGDKYSINAIDILLAPYDSKPSFAAAIYEPLK